MPALLHDTAVEYMYRDAGNYKFYGDFVLSGVFRIEAVQEFLICSEYFVPEKIGLISLVPEQKNDDDHQLHEFLSAKCVPKNDAKYIMTSKQFIRRIKRSSELGWFFG